jgi:hypothetical protein
MAFFGIPTLAFWLVTLFVGVVTAVMVWHWHAYRLKSPVIPIIEIIYLVGILLLLGVSFVELKAL